MTLVFDPDYEADANGPDRRKTGKGKAAQPGEGQAGAAPAAPATGPGTATGAISPAAQPGAVPPGSAALPSAGGDSILGRYFGFVPTAPAGRIPRDEVTFGSRRLEQIFQAAKSGGSYVFLFELPKQAPRRASRPFMSSPYTPWLGVNLKVEFQCDMKRDEIYSLGISLVTGQIEEAFQTRLEKLDLTPQLPPNVHLTRSNLTLPRALQAIEQYIEKKLRPVDHTWAAEAHVRLKDELQRIDSYYREMIDAAEPDQKSAIEEQYRNRIAEIEWQYKPRIAVSVINCGLFHLAAARSEPV